MLKRTGKEEETEEEEEQEREQEEEEEEKRTLLLSYILVWIPLQATQTFFLNFPK